MILLEAFLFFSLDKGSCWAEFQTGTARVFPLILQVVTRFPVSSTQYEEIDTDECSVLPRVAGFEFLNDYTEWGRRGWLLPLSATGT